MSFLGLYFRSDVEEARKEEREQVEAECWKKISLLEQEKDELENEISFLKKNITKLKDQNNGLYHKNQRDIRKSKKEAERKIAEITEKENQKISQIKDGHEREKRKISRMAFSAGAWEAFKEVSINLVEEVKGYRTKFDWAYAFLLIATIVAVRMSQTKGLSLLFIKMIFIMLPLLFSRYVVKRVVEKNFEKRLAKIYEENKKSVRDNISLICDGLFSRLTSWIFTVIIFVFMKIAFDLPSLEPSKIYEYLTQLVSKL